MVIVTIEEDIASSLMATATFKQLHVKKLISRSISELHRTVVEAIGVDEIISPEEDSADRLAKRLQLEGVVDSFCVSGKYNIIETNVPKIYVGKQIKECRFRENFNLNIVTVIRSKNDIFGNASGQVLGVIAPDLVLQATDILVLFGHFKDIEELLEKE